MAAAATANDDDGGARPRPLRVPAPDPGGAIESPMHSTITGPHYNGDASQEKVNRVTNETAKPSLDVEHGLEITGARQVLQSQTPGELEHPCPCIRDADTDAQVVRMLGPNHPNLLMIEVFLVGSIHGGTVH